MKLDNLYFLHFEIKMTFFVIFMYKKLHRIKITSWENITVAVY